MKQLTFSSAAYSAKKKVTRREKFLAEMDLVVPWLRMESLIAPHYAKGPSAEGGRIPIAICEKGAEDWVALKSHPGHALAKWTANLNHAIQSLSRKTAIASRASTRL